MKRPKSLSLSPTAAALALLTACVGVGVGTLGTDSASPGVRAATAAPARGGTPIMPVSEVRPGMKGHAVTVFSGTQSDRFEIEVIDVMPDYFPRQPAILFKSPDPRLMHSGIVGGMSGSPIYINGKLVGALAYGYRFNKDPVGGISPIENMLEVDALPFRPEVLPRPRAGGRSKARARAGTNGWADIMLGLDTSPLPARKRPADTDMTAGLVALDSPMGVAGFGPAATRMLADQFGMLPVRGGSGGGGGSTPRTNNKAMLTSAPKKKWKGGDAVSVLLTRGDNAAAVNGTVTWVGGKQGERLLAFGHPMFDAGPVNVPVADARVHVIINSVQRSVKISSPLSLQGTMVQDRQSAIAVRTDVTPRMVPVITHLDPPEDAIPARTYRSEVADAVDLTPGLTAALLVDAASEAASDQADVTAKVTHKIAFESTKGPRTVEVSEEMFFPLGASLRALRRARGVLVLSAMLDNQFEIAKIRSIEQTISMEYGDPVEFIEAVRVAQDHERVHAGDLLRLEVDIRRRHAELRTEILHLRVPDDAGEQDIEIEVTGGDYVFPYRPMPNSLDDLVSNIEQTYPSRALVATIYREQEGLSTRHGLLRDLPGSVLETLTPRGRTTPSVRFKQMARRVIPTKTLIEGRHRVKVSVLPRRSFRSR